MNTIKLSDVTMKQAADGFSLSFKEKIELSKLLDKLGVSVIELEAIENSRIDSLRINLQNLTKAELDALQAEYGSKQSRSFTKEDLEYYSVLSPWCVA